MASGGIAEQIDTDGGAHAVAFGLGVRSKQLPLRTDAVHRAAPLESIRVP